MLTSKEGWFAGMLTNPKTHRTVWKLCCSKKNPLRRVHALLAGEGCRYMTCFIVNGDFVQLWKSNKSWKGAYTSSRWGNMQPVHLDNSRLVTKSHVKLDLVPLNPSVSDSGLLGASEISETCCQRNLWRLLLNFRKIWRLWLSEDGDGKAHLNRTKSSFPFAALRATCTPWLGETPRATWAPWQGETLRAMGAPWLEETVGKRRSLPSLFPLIPHGGKLNTPSESVQTWCTCGFVWPCVYLSWDPSSRCCAEIALHWSNCSSSRWSSVNLMQIITQTLKHRDDVETASQDQNG